MAVVARFCRYMVTKALDSQEDAGGEEPISPLHSNTFVSRLNIALCYDGSSIPLLKDSKFATWEGMWRDAQYRTGGSVSQKIISHYFVTVGITHTLVGHDSGITRKEWIGLKGVWSHCVSKRTSNPIHV